MQHLTIECLIGFAEGRLSPETRLHVEQHIANCADCSGTSEWFLLSDLLTVTHYAPKNEMRNTLTLTDISKSVSNFRELFATGFFESRAAARVSVQEISDCRQ